MLGCLAIALVLAGCQRPRSSESETGGDWGEQLGQARRRYEAAEQAAAEAKRRYEASRSGELLRLWQSYQDALEWAAERRRNYEETPQEANLQKYVDALAWADSRRWDYEDVRKQHPLWRSYQLAWQRAWQAKSDYGRIEQGKAAAVNEAAAEPAE